MGEGSDSSALCATLRRVRDEIAGAPITAEEHRLVGPILTELDRGIAASEPPAGASASRGALRAGSDSALDSDDAALARQLARCAALAIDNAHLYREAQRMNRVKDEFLATVSHELRTPLNAVLGWARLLRMGKLDESATARALEIIERNALSQARLIEDLLDVSRIVSGKLRIEELPVDLREVAVAALEAVKLAAEAKAIEIVTHLDEVPAVTGDPTRLQQVVWNLLSNAIKFTPRGGRIEVRLRCVDAHVEIEVTDDGIGVRAEFLPHVFDHFRQADGTTTRVHGGLGIGLAIVRHLTELHGGSVRAESRGESQGATFAVRLPIAGRPEPG
jgi:signal transduction histidine kinase